MFGSFIAWSSHLKKDFSSPFSSFSTLFSLTNCSVSVNGPPASYLPALPCLVVRLLLCLHPAPRHRVPRKPTFCNDSGVLFMVLGFSGVRVFLVHRPGTYLCREMEFYKLFNPSMALDSLPPLATPPPLARVLPHSPLALCRRQPPSFDEIAIILASAPLLALYQQQRPEGVIIFGTSFPSVENGPRLTRCSFFWHRHRL
ncbi:hypothetical protein BYT27DRAFT_6689455 [Phlegmacium glaucopus]|nr:hypothetical protein BYT27DRAFT_6689455 [Phlegmacium glaucopus]